MESTGASETTMRLHFRVLVRKSESDHVEPVTTLSSFVFSCPTWAEMILDLVEVSRLMVSLTTRSYFFSFLLRYIQVQQSRQATKTPDDCPSKEQRLCWEALLVLIQDDTSHSSQPLQPGILAEMLTGMICYRTELRRRSALREMIDEERDPDVYEAIVILEILSTAVGCNTLLRCRPNCVFCCVVISCRSRSFILDRCSRL
jgi:hypothetical protein